MWPAASRWGSETRKTRTRMRAATWVTSATAQLRRRREGRRRAASKAARSSRRSAPAAAATAALGERRRRRLHPLVQQTRSRASISGVSRRQARRSRLPRRRPSHSMLLQLPLQLRHPPRLLLPQPSPSPPLPHLLLLHPKRRWRRRRRPSCLALQLPQRPRLRRHSPSLLLPQPHRPSPSPRPRPRLHPRLCPLLHPQLQSQPRRRRCSLSELLRLLPRRRRRPHLVPRPPLAAPPWEVASAAVAPRWPAGSAPGPSGGHLPPACSARRRQRLQLLLLPRPSFSARGQLLRLLAAPRLARQGCSPLEVARNETAPSM